MAEYKEVAASKKADADGDMPKLIRIEDHPANRDRDAVLMTTGRYRGRDIYRHPKAGGFVACIGYLCFEGLFPTMAAATAAQDHYLKDNSYVDMHERRLPEHRPTDDGPEGAEGLLTGESSDQR